MAKRKRREQQHLRQQPVRRRSYTVGGGSHQELYKPGFPMNLFQNVKLFFAIGAVVMIGSVVAAALLRGSNASRSQAAVPTATATATHSATVDPSASPEATPTPNPKSFTKAEQVIDATKNSYTATFKTSKGEFVLNLNADVAPNTVNSFVFLAQKGYFDGVLFHRVVSGFVVQGGDPKGDGSGGPGYTTADEPNEVPNKRGTLSMAKTSGAKVFGSQFFINLKDNASLDFNSPAPDKFYPFAEVVSGMEVVDAIASVRVDTKSKPLEPVTIESVRITETPKQ